MFYECFQMLTDRRYDIVMLRCAKLVQYSWFKDFIDVRHLSQPGNFFACTML